VLRSLALAITAVALVAGVSGCAKFDNALGQQWIQVTFAPNTSIATARHVVSECSHIPNLPLMGRVRQDTGQPGVVDQVNFNSTNATAGEMAQLEQCLSKFPSIVQGFTQMDQGNN
jgi:hypothetical protein